MMFFRKSFVLMVFLLVSLSSLADPKLRGNVQGQPSKDPAPMVMLKSITDQMLQKLKAHIGKLKNNEKLVNSLVNEIIVPHFDLVSMSKAVVGRDYWQQASDSTRQQFIKEFTDYVIRTYSAALQSYDGEIMKFYPMRETLGERVRISSDLLLKNGPPIQLQYGLLKQGDQWLIYDFSVDGVSIVKNYSAQFAGILRQKKLDGLVRELQKRNVGK